MSLQVFKIFNIASDAYLLKSKLESEGIQCYLENEHMSALYPVHNLSIGGLKLKVFEEDFQKAFKIYDQIQQEKNPEDRSSGQCPSFGSVRINQTETNSKRGFIDFLKSTFLHQKGLEKYSCNNCKFQFWKGKDKPMAHSDN